MTSHDSVAVVVFTSVRVVEPPPIDRLSHSPLWHGRPFIALVSLAAVRKCTFCGSTEHLRDRCPGLFGSVCRGAQGGRLVRSAPIKGQSKGSRRRSQSIATCGHRTVLPTGPGGVGCLPPGAVFLSRSGRSPGCSFLCEVKSALTFPTEGRRTDGLGTPRGFEDARAVVARDPGGPGALCRGVRGRPASPPMRAPSVGARVVAPAEGVAVAAAVRRRPIAFAERKCYICGNRGHTQSDCPGLPRVALRCCDSEEDARCRGRRGPPSAVQRGRPLNEGSPPTARQSARPSGRCTRTAPPARTASLSTPPLPREGVGGWGPGACVTGTTPARFLDKRPALARTHQPTVPRRDKARSGVYLRDCALFFAATDTHCNQRTPPLEQAAQGRRHWGLRRRNGKKMSVHEFP